MTAYIISVVLTFLVMLGAAKLVNGHVDMRLLIVSVLASLVPIVNIILSVVAVAITLIDSKHEFFSKKLF